MWAPPRKQSNRHVGPSHDYVTRGVNDGRDIIERDVARECAAVRAAVWSQAGRPGKHKCAQAVIHVLATLSELYVSESKAKHAQGTIATGDKLFDCIF